ncbi:MAG: hypothetical protein GQ535_14675 [Rhodobacteraceae bacterium]|nr:hypothetical protein [Paracoccaceae bacterium]
MRFSQLFTIRSGAWILAFITPSLALVVLISILTGGISSSRSFLVEANTTGMSVQFSGLNNAWPLGRATICAPLDRPKRENARGTGPCDERRYTPSENDDLLLEFPDGSSATVLVQGNGGLAIQVSGMSLFGDNTRILVARDDWIAVGAMVFSGQAVIGGQMGSGQQNILLDGRFEVRETSSFSLGGRNRIEVIKSGTLLRGEQASISESGADTTVTGHITWSDNRRSMDVVIVSLPGNTALSLGHIGGDQVSSIQPDWIDYALASPTLVALTLVLSICIGAGQLFFTATSYLRKTNRTSETTTTEGQ